MINFEGLFFTKESYAFLKSLEKQKLPISSDIYHCTFKLFPDKNEVFSNLIGKEFEVEIIGYASDEMNSGFLINIPDELKEYYLNYDENMKLITPHITTSINYGAKNRNTQNLKFEKFNKSYKVKGIFGMNVRKNNKNVIIIDQKDIQCNFFKNKKYI